MSEEQLTITRGGEERIVMGRLLPKKSYRNKLVSSSFITKIDYVYNRGMGTGTFTIFMKSGVYPYQDVPFEVFEAFFYAHSKGTYYNKYIKGVYK